MALVVAPSQQTNIEFSKPFQNEFHQRLMILINSAGIVMNGAEEQDWALRYHFSKGNAVAVYDIFFNGKEQFTRIMAQRNKCVGPELAQEVERILTQGLSS